MGTGFTQDQLQQWTDKFLALQTADCTSIVFNSRLKPSFWIEPKVVWEISFDSYSFSSLYRLPSDYRMKIKDEVQRLSSQIDESGSVGKTQSNDYFSFGVSLRFPVFKRERADKTPEACSSMDQLVSEALATGLIENNFNLN